MPGSAESGNGYRVGVMFVDLDPEHRQLIERFTRQ
jgi:hypothetical protein